jgi:hypothetical protein
MVEGQQYAMPSAGCQSVPAGPCAVDGDAQRDHAAVPGDLDAVDQQTDQVQARQVGGQQLSQSVLGAATSGGDRHLNFHGDRDNLAFGRRTGCSGVTPRVTPAPGATRGCRSKRQTCWSEARPEGFEPPTRGLEARRESSVQLLSLRWCCSGPWSLVPSVRLCACGPCVLLSFSVNTPVSLDVAPDVVAGAHHLDWPSPLQGDPSPSGGRSWPKRASGSGCTDLDT